MTNVAFCKELNKVNKIFGDKTNSAQNLTNMFNEDTNISPKTLVRMELALKLPFGTLLNLSKEPVGKQAKKELEKMIKKARENYDY